MKKLEHFLLPEQSNRLYEKEAFSSISLTRNVAKKINELVDAYNELDSWNYEKHQEQDGEIRKGILYIKDNLINTLHDFIKILEHEGFFTKTVSEYTEVLEQRLNHLLGIVQEGSTSGDAELIDGRINYDGIPYANIGEHIRKVTKALKELFDNIDIEGYEKEDMYIDVKSSGAKYENFFFRTPDSDRIASTGWNFYVFDVQPKEVYKIKTYTVSAGRCVTFVSEDLSSADRNPGFNYIPEEASKGEILEFTVEVPFNAVKMIVNENINQCEALIGKCYGSKFSKIGGTQTSVLSGKTLVCCGDSITEAIDPDGDYFKNYAELVAERHGMTCIKDGIGGSTISNIGNGKSFTEGRYLNVPSFDYLTIWFGWNDAAYSSLGTINDTTDKTFYGAYNKVLTHFITQYPTKKIGIIVPYCSDTKIQEAVRKLSSKFGVPCLDLADSQKCSLIWDLKTETGLARTNALTYDTTHPNQAGYDFISTMYEQFLLSL